MNPETQRIEELFDRALQFEPEERAAFLAGACGNDVNLRRRVEDLLIASESREHFLPKETIDSATLDFEMPVSEGAGTVIGRYKLLEKLGEGGFGVVWAADQREPVKRRVALKIIKLGMDTKQVVARFEVERQALALMDHPNIAKVLDAGATDTGRPFFVMELVKGIPITKYCEKEKLAVTDRLELFIKVSQAIQHAHQKGIIHRDIKPSNVMVTLHDGVPVPKVIDFGIAKATQQELTERTVYTQYSQFIGTPAYMSPEQAEMSGLDIDTRSDIYSLGVLLYELLAGSTPFETKELMQSGIDEMRKIIREQEPVRPSTRLSQTMASKGPAAAASKSFVQNLPASIETDLDWIVMKCLEKERGRRYDTANGLAADLTRFLTNEPVVARPPSAIYRFQKLVRRNKVASFASLGIAMALVVGAGAVALVLTQKNAALEGEAVAQQRELDQSVRADTMTAVIDRLLSDAVPTLMRQGNNRGARELVDAVDDLATNSLSDSPAAEINLRSRLIWQLLFHFGDFVEAHEQAESIDRLLPAVSDGQLEVSRDELRFQVSNARLMVTLERPQGVPQAMKEMDALFSEFMERTPPLPVWGLSCRYSQGRWYQLASMLAEAETALGAAYELLPNCAIKTPQTLRTPRHYADVLAAQGKWNRAEKVLRENLDLPPDPNLMERIAYKDRVRSLMDVLCLQDRHAEATEMLEGQRQQLAAGASLETDLLELEVMLGEVLARSGRGSEALAIFVALLANPVTELRTAWYGAISLAAATGDDDTYDWLCWRSFTAAASTADGAIAYGLVRGLLCRPADESTLAVCRVLVERVSRATDWSKDFLSRLKAELAFREHRYADALAILDQDLALSEHNRIRLTSDMKPMSQAKSSFLGALIYAKLGRGEEARRNIVRGRGAQTLFFKDRSGRDRGRDWPNTYFADSFRREAEEACQAAGINLPKSDPTNL